MNKHQIELANHAVRISCMLGGVFGAFVALLFQSWAVVPLMALFYFAPPKIEKYLKELE